MKKQKTSHSSKSGRAKGFHTIAGGKLLKAQVSDEFVGVAVTIKQLFYVLLFTLLPIFVIGFAQFMSVKYNHPSWTATQCFESMVGRFNDAKKK